MGEIGPLLASTAAVTLAYAERVLKGIPAEQAACFARPGGVTVQSNHPVFILGHLSLYPARVLAHLGQGPGAAGVPAGWDDRFRNGVECRDDPQGHIYPRLAAVSEFFFRSYAEAARAISAAHDEVLLAANPSEGRMRELFPKLGAMLSFYLSGHPQQHLGQLSAWRRAMGLPPA